MKIVKVKGVYVHGKNMYYESTKVQNPRRNSVHHALNSKCQGPCIILRMRVECLAVPCRPSPVSGCFTAVAPVASL